MSIPDRAGHKDGNAPKRVLACAAPTLAAHKWLSVGFAKTSFIYMCESHHTQQLALTWPGSAAEPGAQHSQGKLRQQVGAAGPGRSSSLPVDPGTTHRLLSSTHILGGSQAEPTRAANTARAPLPHGLSALLSPLRKRGAVPHPDYCPAVSPTAVEIHPAKQLGGEGQARRASSRDCTPRTWPGVREERGQGLVRTDGHGGLRHGGRRLAMGQLGSPVSPPPVPGSSQSATGRRGAAAKSGAGTLFS